MIKTNYNFLLYLSFSFSIFDFATTLLNNEVYTFEWIISIAISSVLSLFVAMIILKRKTDFKIMNFIIIIYIFCIIIRYINRFSTYVDEMHSVNSFFGIAILSIGVILYLLKFHKESFERISPIILFITVLMLLIVFLINFNKIQAVNIYVQEKIVLLNINIIKVYDWVIPLCLLEKEKKTNKSKIYKFIITNGILLMFISVFRGFSIRGNSLYSLSPLHSLFSISKGITIQRFDYLFTLFLIICMFSVFLLNIAVINKIRNNNEYIKKRYLFILFILAFLISYFTSIISNFYLALVIIFFINLNVVWERRKNEN